MKDDKLFCILDPTNLNHLQYFYGICNFYKNNRVLLQVNFLIYFISVDSTVLTSIKAQNNGRSALYTREGERLSLPPCDPVSHF